MAQMQPWMVICPPHPVQITANQTGQSASVMMARNSQLEVMEVAEGMAADKEDVEGVEVLEDADKLMEQY